MPSRYPVEVRRQVVELERALRTDSRHSYTPLMALLAAKLTSAQPREDD